MKRNKILSLGLSVMIITLLSACSQDELTDNSNNAAIGQLVEINANDGAMFAAVRAVDEGDITPLPTDYRFALRMYYDNRNTTANTEYNTFENVYMQVSSSPENIRCIYTDQYKDRTEEEITNNSHAENAPKLYWNNRKNHGFVGFFLNNEPKTAKPTLEGKDYLTFDLNYQTKEDSVFQYDPMLAVKQQEPTSGNNLANRVYLLFEHQASCVEVNVNTDKVSVEPLPSSGTGESGEQAIITKICLLGTAKEITVFTKMDKDGNIVRTNNGVDETVQDYVDYNKKDDKQTCYSLPSEEEIDALELLPLYSKFDESTKDQVKANYNATARGLAFGDLKGLRIVWKEKRTGEEGVEEVEHDITYKFIDNSEKENYQKLLSGKKYIYNVTLRRSTIATINLKIEDWVDDEAKDYEANGIIVPRTEKEGD